MKLSIICDTVGMKAETEDTFDENLAKTSMDFVL